ncbi:MAG TPA: formylmethanofuran--tetrahydromethanopterin N-formyltransferase [Archaeoglobus profundus]|nr:formylmethanofuran--tetrahydromethanopterin N-formyltransferase [Archaeoglobus profundus]
MIINGVEIEDTFAELFDIKIARILITALDYEWALIAAREAVGFGTSVIMCPAEAGIEKLASPEETPDGRAGVYIMICHPNEKNLEKQLIARIGQCVLTAPTTAVFDGFPESEKKFDVGNKIRYFGDGFEKQVEVGGRKCWSIPIMEGEFIIENDIGYINGLAGGNIIIMGENQTSALMAAKAAVDAISNVEGVITPFPGGIVASGSKVGSKKYKFLVASTNEKFCPSLRDVVDTNIPSNVKSVYEIVINGISIEHIKKAMRIGILAATKVPGVIKITAANFEGKLGKHKINLLDLFK